MAHRSPEAILRSLVADVRGVRQSHGVYGPLETDGGYDVAVKWPNLTILIDEAAAALAALDKA